MRSCPKRRLGVRLAGKIDLERIVVGSGVDGAEWRRQHDLVTRLHRNAMKFDVADNGPRRIGEGKPPQELLDRTPGQPLQVRNQFTALVGMRCQEQHHVPHH